MKISQDYVTPKANCLPARPRFPFLHIRTPRATVRLRPVLNLPLRSKGPHVTSARMGLQPWTPMLESRPQAQEEALAGLSESLTKPATEETAPKRRREHGVSSTHSARRETTRLFQLAVNRLEKDRKIWNLSRSSTPGQPSNVLHLRNNTPNGAEITFRPGSKWVALHQHFDL